VGSVEDTARARDVRLIFVSASTIGEIETGFASFLQQGADALLVSSDGFFLSHPDQIVALAARHAVPAIYGWPEAMAIGGLMSYGTDIIEGWRQAGVYTGRILKGETPADLPVQQVTKVELIINLKTAQALGVTFPLNLLGRADKVIE
jgi:putative ABC transport system substrate-binding protein